MILCAETEVAVSLKILFFVCNVVDRDCESDRKQLSVVCNIEGTISIEQTLPFFGFAKKVKKVCSRYH